MCWRWRFRGGGLVGLEQTRFYSSQELRTEMGSVLQVLFRSQIQPLLISWLLSWPVNWGSAFNQWPHTQMGSHTQKHNTLSLFQCKRTFTHIHTRSQTHRCKTIQMCLINAHSTWEEDLHYFMVCRFNWSQDKMISERNLSCRCFPFSSHRAFWNSFARRRICPWMCAAVILVLILKLGDSSCMLWWFNALFIVLSTLHPLIKNAYNYSSLWCYFSI